ncbi:hypothetical protein Sjap_002468 [Stephania japonica]|uniref:BHLH domain-containing protein n=1 Tax=Stephania japonica TaxID=461633 RepID=A0AAP0PSJ9_9MAGN
MATDIRCEWDDAAAHGSSDEGRAGRSSDITGVDARERHKLAERERRKSMRELFLSLHSLLPHSATVRKEQSAILDEIIKYIPIATARLRSLQKQREAPSILSSRSSASVAAAAKSSPSLKVSSRSKSNSGECSIRVMPQPSSSVSIRVRGDRVNVSLTDTNGANNTILVSSLLDVLEAHNLELVRFRGRIPDLKKSSTQEIIVLETVSHWNWKKRGLQLSGPGDLKPPMLNTYMLNLGTIHLPNQILTLILIKMGEV